MDLTVDFNNRIQDEEPKQYNNVRKLKCENCRN